MPVEGLIGRGITGRNARERIDQHAIRVEDLPGRIDQLGQAADVDLAVAGLTQNVRGVHIEGADVGVVEGADHAAGVGGQLDCLTVDDPVLVVVGLGVVGLDLVSFIDVAIVVVVDAVVGRLVDVVPGNAL